ncbi:uncharacterized protein LOC129250071 [Anastrepha obliqua]|uniref:uncharacterized protein LOC129250071 n=1 Tax=Anastrepha obliqua TaxID=95512 RepID=UPI00240A6D2F|nr:uncharacterized protein LOC129250071 [Anastrepha obliqua]
MSEFKPFLCNNIDKSLLRSEWEKWFRSLSLYLQCEDINDAVKRRNKLLHLGGPQLQEVIFNILGAVVDVDEINKNDVYNISVGKLNEFFSPKRNSTFERHLFRNLSPLEGEDFNTFLLRLRQCEYGSTKAEIESNCLKDKLIDSWASIDLKKKLLEKEQSLDEVISAWQIHEQINKQSQSMTAKTNSEVVNKITAKHQPVKGNVNECERCGKYGHMQSDVNCPARKSKCNKCGLIGHFARKCKTKAQKRKAVERDRGSPKKRRFQSSNIRHIEEENQIEDKYCNHNCFKVNCNGLGDEV